MIEFLFEYGLFLAKVLTVILGIILVLVTVFSLAQKGKSEEGTLVLTHLNQKMDEIRKSLQTEVLPKAQLKKWIKAEKNTEKERQTIREKQGRLFVLRFDGDIRASQTHGLRECISAIIEIANASDEVLVILESAGGFVQHYGLAASQLQRLREHGLVLTVAIDKCAASGGYMMACVANKILAAPFALIGSIGVVAQLPNFNRLLKKHDIDYEMHTAGEYKRTITMFGENTDEGRAKFQEELEETHTLFKEFISIHRPNVHINEVANGEHWHAAVAKKMELVDELLTSDDYILQKIESNDVFELAYEEKEKISDRILGSFTSALEKGLLKLFHLPSQFFK